jgi:hypothetical protein
MPSQVQEGVASPATLSSSTTPRAQSRPRVPASSPVQRLNPIRRNHVWSAVETAHLVDLLHKNTKYQIALLPGRVTRDQEKGQKVSKSSLFRHLCKEIFGQAGPGSEQRIKSRIKTLSKLYADEKKKLGETGAGLLWKDVRVGTVVCSQRARQEDSKSLC